MQYFRLDLIRALDLSPSMFHMVGEKHLFDRCILWGSTDATGMGKYYMKHKGAVLCERLIFSQHFKAVVV